MTTAVQQNADPYTMYLGQSVNLTTITQEFSHYFTASTTDASAMIKFFVGNNTTCINIDNIVMHEVLITGNGINSFVENQVKIYPNPFSQDIHIQSKGDFEYTIIDLNGIELENGFGTDQISAVGKKLSKGMYLIQVKGKEGIKTFKVTKN